MVEQENTQDNENKENKEDFQAIPKNNFKLQLFCPECNSLNVYRTQRGKVRCRRCGFAQP